ncbi:MAG: PSD1 and planctomycete cytochrome C domain-containing protein [Acidobacteriota bacterium]
MMSRVKIPYSKSLQTNFIKQVICLLAIPLSIYTTFSQTKSSPAIDFNRDIKPIFERHCLACHSAKKAMGGLRLDDATAAMNGGISGAVIIPGKASESRLLQRILGLKDEARMPMGSAPLSNLQINKIRRWIDEGANWNPMNQPRPLNHSDGESQSTIRNPQSAINKHWAYVKPVQPKVPEVLNKQWIRNPIDNFILSRLEKEGLKPSPEANKETLIRRLYLDLIGLPPSPKAVDDFLADTSATAYEKVVDQLLASEHYGERLARHWLDLARYADTNGYEKDNRRVMWKYRDWVIRSFNEDKPFDQFTIEQIAGDMLPDATIDQKIATGFHRNTLLNQEGGVDPEEARFEVLIDRVNTTSTVWLGTTLGCAQCHNHKYDPFTQKDFYRFMAFFDNNQYHFEGNPLERWAIEPKLYLATTEQEARKKAIEEEIKKVENNLKTSTPELIQQQSEWEREVRDAEKAWVPLEITSVLTTNGTKLSKSTDKTILATAPFANRDEYVIKATTSLSNLTALRLEALPDAGLPRGGPGCDPYGGFAIQSIEMAVTPNDGSSPQKIKFNNAKADDGNATAVLLNTSSGWLIDQTNENLRLPRQLVLVAEKPFGNSSLTNLEIKIRQSHPSNKLLLGKFRLSVTASNNPTSVVNIHGKLRPIIQIASDSRTTEQQKQLSDYYRGMTPLLDKERKLLSELKSTVDKLNIPTAEILGEKPTFERPSTFIRIKGSFTNKGEKVFADTPASLPPLPQDQMPNRLGLARWLVSKENPLVARVTVNRFWEQIFGHGMVETSEDFGTQGERPTHPELLDWLASEFMKTWRVKAFLRMIVTSSTYRQTSKINPELTARDPYNRLLARGARFRLEAEMIRDVTLATSGLLNPKVGGESVFPYQPEGIWDNPYNRDRWIISEGGDKFRRGLYTFVRRTAPYPSMVSFDAPSREFCTVRRVRTNTPLQALTTLNDEAFFIAARALAQRMVHSSQSAIKEKITFGFRLCTSRKPSEQEVNRLIGLYEQQVLKYSQDIQSAKNLLKEQVAGLSDNQIPELAAMTIVANVLLNLDETLTKE